MDDLHAFIGAWVRGDKVFYVRRSLLMDNYPGTWSLFSIQCSKEEFEGVYQDCYDYSLATRAMREMSAERLCGSPISVVRYLRSASCANNPMNLRVRLHLYKVELPGVPILNPRFYTGGQWMTKEEYDAASAALPCGLCTKMLHDCLSGPK